MEGRKYTPYPIHSHGCYLAGLSNGFVYSSHDLNGEIRTSDEVLAQYDFEAMNEMIWKMPLAGLNSLYSSVKVDETGRLGIVSSNDVIGGFIVGESSEVDLLVDDCAQTTYSSVNDNQISYIRNSTFNCLRADPSSGELKPRDMRYTNLKAELCEINHNGGFLIWNRWNGLGLVDPEIRNIRYAPDRPYDPLTVETPQKSFSGVAMQAHPTRDVVAVLDSSGNLEIYDKRNLSCALFKESFVSGRGLAVMKNEVCLLDRDINAVRTLSVTNFEHQNEIYMPEIKRLGRYYMNRQQWSKPPGSKYAFPTEYNPTGETMVPSAISRSSDSLLINTQYAVLKVDSL